jgi:CubicO group peptidase (beta-lactamase class C family)
MRNKITLLIIIPLFIISCSKSEDEKILEKPVQQQLYFPSLDANANWETKSSTDLNWNQSAKQPLLEYLSQKGTKSFMILVDGKIAMEEYFNGHDQVTQWQWNSAGKTLTSVVVGIAQQEGLLSINDKVSGYLGEGWTSEPLEKENLITLKNLLTMTSGIEDSNNLVIKSNLTYLADAGTRWSYHNVFQKLMDVVAAASSKKYDVYFSDKLKNKIGMDGAWKDGLIYNIYHSNTRSMARFGLLALNKGKWKTEQIINENYFIESTSTSQNINPAYGYLWWLNGKSSSMIPGGQKVYQGSLVPSAPKDMYAAMGASDQRIYVIPSKNMVIIRMGEASNPANPSFAVSGFDEELWQKINAMVE